MSFFDRDRLIIAVLVSVVVHGGVFALISMADFETSVPEFSGPVYVELPEVVETQFPPEERPEEEQREPEERPEDAVAAEPEEPEEAEAPPEEPAESSQQMQPEAAQPERAQPQQQAPPEQEAPEPEAQPRAQRAPEPAQADVPETAPAESDAQETRPQREAQPEPVDPLARRRDEPVEVSDAELYGRSPQPRRDREAPEEPEGFLPPDTGEPERELPVWVQDIMDGTDISTTDMSREEATRLAEKIRTDPALQRQLESVVSAVEAARTDRERSPESTPSTDEDHEDRTPSEAAPGADTPGPETPGDAQRQEGPEGSQLRFLGDGTGALRPVDPFPQDLLSAGDFPGVVPAELTFVIVFEIDPSGIVVPGSVIFQQKSSYTVVNEKIRRAVLNWGFTPHGGDEPVTAIFTPIVRREDVRS